MQVARNNAEALGADVQFLHLDFLHKADQDKLGRYNIIVSNPPYIPLQEKESLHRNVRDFEPETALFVADDALLFYRAIAEFGKTHLLPAGAIYCELHRDFAIATEALFTQNRYTTALRKDLHGADRMLKAWLSK